MISPPASRGVNSSLAPWQAEPLRLWSLLEMLRFYGAVFFTVVTDLERVQSDLLFMKFAPEGMDVAARVVKAVSSLREEMQKLPLPSSVRARLNRLAKAVEGEITEDRISTLTAHVNELQLDLQHELAQHLFLFIPAERKWLWLEPEKWFGEDVASKFVDARRDMRDCAKCLALDQWTASVFHAMAIMEHGLRHLAGRVGISLSPNFDFENWHNIIEQIEAEIKAKKQLPRAQQNQTEIEFCSSAASHFFAVKEAWRNHVSHGRGQYDEVEALRVVHNVRDFMKVLAT